MGPKPSLPQSGELFRPRLDEQLNMQHPLLRLAALIDWAEIERTFAVSFTSGRGRPALGGTVGQEIRSAIEAGKEVTFHESGINAHGFSGHGYIITDPDTGGGAYLVEGKGNGAVLFVAGVAVIYLATFIGFTGVGMVIASAAYVLGIALIAAGLALLSGDAGLCKDILVNASATFFGALAAAAAAGLLMFGWAIQLADQILVDLLVGVGVATGISQVDRVMPLFEICNIK